METRLPVGLSLLTVLMLAVSGWLGGTMVHEHGVGVEPHTGDRRHYNAEEESAAIEAHGERRMGDQRFA